MSQAPVALSGHVPSIAEIADRLRDPARLARVGPWQSDSIGILGVRPDKPAAVLVPIVLHPEPTILLTLRAAKMSSHAGQVAFPGGRIEPGETPEQAAIREAAEEVGLDPRLPEIVTSLPEHLVGTGFRVTPVVAFVPAPLNLSPDPGEVQEAFELSLSVVLDPSAPVRRSAEFKGQQRHFWVWPHERHYIWGATAAMLVTLATILRD